MDGNGSLNTSWNQHVIFAKSSDNAGATIGYNTSIGFYFNMAGWSNITVLKDSKDYMPSVVNHKWTNLAVTATNSSVKIYVNYQLVQELSGNIALTNMNNQGLSFGRFNDQYWYPTWGELQDIRVFTTILDSNAVGRLYYSGAKFVDCPKATITGDSLICAGDTATLKATALGATDISWLDATVSATDIAVAPLSSRYYKVMISYIDTVAYDSSFVTVKPRPSLTLSASKQFSCAGEQIQLKALGVDTCIWSTTTKADSILVAPTVSSVYSVRPLGCITNIDTIGIVVRSLPTVSATALPNSFVTSGE